MAVTLAGTYVPSAQEWVRDQIEAYERSGGREENLYAGIPIIVVTMRGAKTGYVRKIALMRVEHRGEYALVASFGGAPKHPVWYWNLIAHPDEVLIQDGPEPFRASVREVHGAERTEWWERSLTVYHSYADYQTLTDRVFPVFVASPVS